jgi:membrane-bound metal-dependent hydrolase YbcI (DUF457 family)
MKGISHFAVGVAAASCFPATVEAGAAGNPLYFILGGLAGLLPDTMDFKFYRFFHRHDIEVVPDPKKFEARIVADALALAVNKAATEGRAIRIKLATVRLGADLWRQYEVRFDTRRNEVRVTPGPVVGTSGQPLDHESAEKAKPAIAGLPCPIKLEYEAVTTIDAFDGPMYAMEPVAKDKVMIRFIPWHRRWSHSLVIALLFSLISWLALGPLAGMVFFAAYAMHVALDQLGFMGSNLFFPFTRERTNGLKKVRSTDPLPNLSAVWTSCLVIFWNLYRASPLSYDWLNPVKLLVYGFALPALAILLIRRVLTRPREDG